MFACFCFCIYAAGKCISFCCGTHYCSLITTLTTSKFNSCVIVWLCWQRMWRNHTQTSHRAHELMLEWGCFLTYLHPVNLCNKTGILVKPFFRHFLSPIYPEIAWKYPGLPWQPLLYETTQKNYSFLNYHILYTAAPTYSLSKGNSAKTMWGWTFVKLTDEIASAAD